LPGGSEVGGVRGDGVCGIWIAVVAADGDYGLIVAGDGEDSGGGVAAENWSCGDGPRAGIVCRTEDSSGGAAGGEEDVVLVGAAEDEGCVAGGEKAFGGEGGWFGGLREFGPMLAVVGVEDGKFAVDRVADREAVFLAPADEAVEEESGARVGVLRVPGSAAVGRFVDVGFIFGADGEYVGDVGTEATDATEVLGAGVVDGAGGPRFAAVGGTEDDAVGAGGPDDLCVLDGGGGDAAEAGVGAAGVEEDLRSLRLWRDGEE
jgi:hypothetical protein